MKESLAGILNEIRSKEPKVPQIESTKPQPGQVWFPHYSAEMKALLDNTALLQKCRPVYILAINGICVTVLKIKTVHVPVVDLIRPTQVLFKDDMSKLRTVECAEAMTMHIADFNYTDARFMYTLNADVRKLVQLTCGLTYGLPISIPDEELEWLKSYRSRVALGVTQNSESDLGGDDVIDLSPESETTNRYDMSLPAPKHNSGAPSKFIPANTGAHWTIRQSNNVNAVVERVTKYMSRIEDILKIAPSRESLTTEHDGFLDPDGTINIITAIHKTLFTMMVESGAIENIDVGYNGYRKTLVKNGICDAKYKQLMVGDIRNISYTHFNIKSVGKAV